MTLSQNDLTLGRRFSELIVTVKFDVSWKYLGYPISFDEISIESPSCRQMRSHHVRNEAKILLVSIFN